MPTNEQYAAYNLSLMQAELSKKCLIEVFIELGIPDTFLDVGCGPGHLVLYAAAAGCLALGIDICLPPGEQVYKQKAGGIARLISMDLTKTKSFERAGMVVCWEVAEHLPEPLVDHLCKLLAESTERYLLFTAAVPGQGGAGHLNEKPKSYWRERILSYHGMTYDSVVTEVLTPRMLQVAPAAPWYGNNLQVFQRLV